MADRIRPAVLRRAIRPVNARSIRRSRYVTRAEAARRLVQIARAVDQSQVIVRRCVAVKRGRSRFRLKADALV